MHHHHPPLPITSTAAAVATGSTAVGNVASPAAVSATANNASAAAQQQQQRRRKKRPNYGTRTVEVRRGYNGFGFTISGQQPCRLSCIISNSPAEQAGLRAGDFLISVNGLNVSKLPHETVVQLIGNSFGSIRMQIAENYYSDSSDEENANATLLLQQNVRGARGLLAASLGSGMRSKPRFLHHKSKLHRLRNSPQKKPHEPATSSTSACAERGVSNPRQQPVEVPPSLDQSALRPVLEDVPNASVNKTGDVANVSAMVRVAASASLEYRVIVGYLGTIEMPKQISHSSKLQTVRSCIRKLRQEKRQPTIVLMCITPDCLRLQSANGNTLATYASARLNYVSSSSESENRFFGLVTSAVHNTQIEEDYELEPSNDNNDNKSNAAGHISISHSCHVFVIDTKLIEHSQHLPRAHEFRLQCTRDPISNLCLEFPNNSEYVVNLIRSMYTMRILPPASRNQLSDNYEAGGAGGAAAAAHSPQPSNHSEISTTTSNSDSGIGFNNDCTNISDRILVVDFAGAAAAPLPQAPPPPAVARPLGIFGVDMATVRDNRLTVRAMPDPKSPACSLRRPNLLASFNLIKSPATNLTATRSCDDVLNLLAIAPNTHGASLAAVASMDDISLHSAAPSLDLNETHMFVQPACVALPRKSRRSLQPQTPHKLSAQVFSKPPRHSLGFEAIDNIQTTAATAVATAACYDQLDTWTSLQNIHQAANAALTTAGNASCTSIHSLLEATNSEPDLGSRALPANASPFRHGWGQSSFRTPRTDKLAKQQQKQQHNGSPLVRRAASMTASDNDTYMKTIEQDGNAFLQDALKQARSQQQLATLQLPQIVTTEEPKNAARSEPTQDHDTAIGPRGWGSSFERMLQDAAGMQTFAEFLKKEFSAENIYFWTACERYRQLENEGERVALARKIFATHLSNNSSDPVNVDSQARNLSEEQLKSAASDIFAASQKQIFNLMKFDSYQRFIRSDLYKSCVEAEQAQRPLPFSGADLDEMLKTNFHLPASSKLKKSASNAEDRRRKSLLPWHRKTRSKSRDRNELIADLQNSQKLSTLMPAPPPPPSHAIKQCGGLSSSSLKIASTQNSLSDLHSSRSSLSSFDASATGQGASAENVCSLCRVILTDGATTIVQTRPDETVAQLVERLLEKRGLVYPFYDIVYHGSSKSIDVQLPSHVLAGKEVSIERRVAFKLDLPDPKVILVKSKPKKQLHEVIRPILHKYNYSISGVRVLLRDTQATIDLMQPVTVADGQRLQIVPDFQQGGGTCLPPKINKPMKPLPITATAAAAANKRHGMLLQPPASQSKLDEITNKVFNELLQSKVEAASASDKQRPSDVCSMHSGDAPSEGSSSMFERLRRQQRDASNIPGSKLPKLKKKSNSSQHSEETQAVAAAAAVSLTDAKPKPIIAKLKAGVKLQVTERVAEHQDELLEGLKRAQLARLEDQRGTEINFELPDFLKNKENLNAAASKLRKMRANLSPINKSSNSSGSASAPQPAPRFSITRTEKATATGASVSPMKVDIDDGTESVAHIETEALASEQTNCSLSKGPPPLPPKPKVLPIKPSNWGVNATPASAPVTTGNYCNKFSPTKPTSPAATTPTTVPMCFGNKITLDIGRKSLETVPGARCAYLDEPSSSFV